MVAYSFKPSFVPAIRGKIKTQTIRLPRKRHARPGEDLQHYCGMRTRSCFLIGRATCVGQHDVRLDFAENVVELDSAVVHDTPEALDAFAVRDGFLPPERLDVTPWAYMRKWWSVTHGDIPVFRGVLIDWGETFVAPEPAGTGEGVAS